MVHTQGTDQAVDAELVAERVVEHVTDLPPHAAVAVPEAIERLRDTIDHRATFVEASLRNDEVIDLPELSEADIVEVRETVEQLQQLAGGA